jgi:hypothetical protein
MIAHGPLERLLLRVITPYRERKLIARLVNFILTSESVQLNLYILGEAYWRLVFLIDEIFKIAILPWIVSVTQAFLKPELKNRKCMPYRISKGVSIMTFFRTDAYYSRYITGMKKVVYGVSLLQLVLTWPSWAYHNVKSQWTQVLPCLSLARSLWLKTTGVSLTLTKCAPWVLVIIDPHPCGFAGAFECLSFIHFAQSWMSKLTPYGSLFLP